MTLIPLIEKMEKNLNRSYIDVTVDAGYESEFAKIVMGHSIKAAEQERQLKQKELHTLNARNDELDNLFEHIYEDNVSGKKTYSENVKRTD